jgi:hypothetical protein
MFGLLFFLILAQAAPSTVPSSASPSPSGLLTGWTAMPSEPTEYSHYVRHETDNSDSILIATRRVCDCQVEPLLTGVMRGLTTITKGAAVENRTSLSLCGQPAQRIVVTGLPSPANALRNLEVIAFRDHDALVTLAYTFRYASPMPDAERAQIALCPPTLG